MVTPGNGSELGLGAANRLVVLPPSLPHADVADPPWPASSLAAAPNTDKWLDLLIDQSRQRLSGDVDAAPWSVLTLPFRHSSSHIHRARTTRRQ